MNLGGLDFSATVAALARGDIPGAIDAADTAIVAYASLAVPAAGLIVAGFIGGIEALWSVGATSPCTIAGCESTFGMSACDEFDAGNPFLWSSIADSLVAAVPPDTSYHFSGNPDTGPTNLIDWGSNDWQPHQTGTLDQPSPEVSGSFEQALELAVMTLWDKLASAPIRNTIKASGQGWRHPLEQQPAWCDRQHACGQRGRIRPIFLAGWNSGHGVGSITTSVPCTQASCEAAGGVWIASDNQCGRGGVAVPCTRTTLAPQRRISHVVGSGQFGDPLSIAFDALAQIQGIPAGKNLVMLVNSGPAGGQTGGWNPHIGNHPSMGAAAKTVLWIGGTAVVLAGSYSLWAFLSGQAQSEAWKRLGHTIWDQSAKSGEHLVAANPLKGAKLLGAGEAAEEAPKKSLKVQSLLFPKSEFTVAQSRAWARAHQFKAAKVEGHGEYHRIRQFSPARSTVLRTIPFGDSGIKAVVAR